MDNEVADYDGADSDLPYTPPQGKYDFYKRAKGSVSDAEALRPRIRSEPVDSHVFCLPN